jgi:hypothetical protein
VHTDKASVQVASHDNAFGSPGVIGLAPSSLSDVHTILNGTAGSTSLLDTLFHQHPSVSSYTTITLSRAESTGTPNMLTIGELLPGYEAIIDAPRLPLEASTPGLGQQWAVLLDAQAFRVNGALLSLPNSAVPHSSDPSRLTALLDTGFSFNQVPRALADAIYADVPGASYAAGSGVWLVPCTTEIQVDVSIGGQTYPVHPLDTVLDVGVGHGLCAGTFQPFVFDHVECTDIVLGMAFLRSVHMRLGFGRPGKEDEFVQLLSTAPKNRVMHEEFVAQRRPVQSMQGLRQTIFHHMSDALLMAFMSRAG